MKIQTVTEIPKQTRAARSGYADYLTNAPANVITSFQELTFAQVTGFKNQAKKLGLKVSSQRTGQRTEKNAQGVEGEVLLYTVFLDKRQPAATVATVPANANGVI